MTIWNLFELIGGLAIFLYGMLLMNKHLTSIAGDKLRTIMLTLTKGKVRGYLTGLGVTIINQSSSATTVLEAALVGAGLLTFTQSVAVTLGSELGSTFLGQIVAFPKITQLATIIIAGGFFSSLIAKSKRGKSIALTVLGFGILFLGMDMMSTSLKPLRSYQPFLDLMVNVENPILGILVGLVFTMIVQSSGATSGLTIAMAVSGTITLSQAVPINMGASVGTCITAVLGSLALNKNAKRTAYVHILFQTIGLVIVFILLSIPFKGERLWLVFVKWVTLHIFHTESLARQVAMAHSMMAVVNHLFIFPMLPIILRIFNKVIPPMKEDQPFGTKYINDSLLETPDIALSQAKKEICREAEIIEDMFGRLSTLFEKKDMETALFIRETDDKVDTLRNGIVPFLTKLSRMELSEKESNREVQYLYIVNQFETIGDIIDKNIVANGIKIIENSLSFSDDGNREIMQLHSSIFENLKGVITAFRNHDTDLALKITETKAEIGQLEADLKKNHIDRLHDGLKETMETSAVHLDLLDNLKRVNGDIVAIAYIILGRL